MWNLPQRPTLWPVLDLVGSLDLQRKYLWLGGRRGGGILATEWMQQSGLRQQGKSQVDGSGPISAAAPMLCLRLPV